MAAYGNSSTTRKALEYLTASIHGDYELLLVDNGSPDDTLEVFLETRKVHKNTQIFSFPANIEYCGAVNTVLSHAKGDCVFFLSNDILVTPTYFSELIACLRDNASYGIARGCSNFVDGSLQPQNLLNGHARFESMVELFKFAEALPEVFIKRVPVDDQFLTGDAFAVSRQTIDRIGGFDTRFVGYFGDPDYWIRCRGAGFRSVVTVNAFAYHDAQANFNYLDHAAREEKYRSRFQRVHAAYQEFQKKYSIADHPSLGLTTPDETTSLDLGLFQTALHLAENKIRADSKYIHVPLKDYSQYLVP